LKKQVSAISNLDVTKELGSGKQGVVFLAESYDSLATLSVVKVCYHRNSVDKDLEIIQESDLASSFSKYSIFPKVTSAIPNRLKHPLRSILVSEYFPASL